MFPYYIVQLVFFIPNITSPWYIILNWRGINTKKIYGKPFRPKKRFTNIFVSPHKLNILKSKEICSCAFKVTRKTTRFKNSSTCDLYDPYKTCYVPVRWGRMCEVQTRRVMHCFICKETPSSIREIYRAYTTQFPKINFYPHIYCCGASMYLWRIQNRFANRFTLPFYVFPLIRYNAPWIYFWYSFTLLCTWIYLKILQLFSFCETKFLSYINDSKRKLFRIE